MSEIEHVACRWDDSEWKHSAPKNYWGVHPIIHTYIHANISPHAADMMDWLKKTFLPDITVPLGLSICCGMGPGDRQALAAGVCSRLEGFDISPKSIELARQHAAEAGYSDRVRYWVDNANTFTLEENRYDIAFAFGAIHHVDALERLCQQLKHGLKPGSLIFLNEYVGPSRFQWGVEQVELLDRVLEIMPPPWRQTKRFEVLPEATIIDSDPSEAVRSDEIIDIFSRHFELVDFCDMGGGLLMPLWERGLIPDVFLESSPIDRQVIIKLLVLLDELITERGIVPPTYAQLVFRNCEPASGNGKQLTKRLSVHSPARQQWTEMFLPEAPAVRAATWWHKPYKGWQILRKEGPVALVAEVNSYLRWLRMR